MTKEMLKRTYTVPLRVKFANTPRYKRTNKAVRVLKEFLVKHMKSEDIKIGPKLNETLWEDGIKNPPGKVKVTATKDEKGVVRAELEGVNYVDFKPQEKRAEKPANLKEKIQSKVDDAKKPVKEEKTDEKVTEKKETKKSEEKPKAEKKVTEKKEESKTEEKSTKEAEKPSDKQTAQKQKAVDEKSKSE